MIIKSAKIDWMKGYGNLPELKVTVDRMPRMDSLTFKRVFDGSGFSYWAANDDDFVTFFYHNPHNQTGYGGSMFRGKLDTGDTFDVKGPWSSNAMDMNATFPPSHNVAYYQTDEVGYENLGFAAHIKMSTAIRLITELGAEYDFIKQYGGHRNEMSVTDVIQVQSLQEKVMLNEVIGHFDIAIRIKGLTLEESQDAKNK